MIGKIIISVKPKSGNPRLWQIAPFTHCSCCRKRYFPFPCPATGSMLPCSAISRKSAELLVGFSPSSLWTSDLPNAIREPRASRNVWTWTAVFAVKTSSMFTFSAPMFTFSEPIFTFSGLLKVPRMCNVRLWSACFSFNRRSRRNISRNSVVSWIPFFRSL